jgi:hypothetical protein
LKQFRVFSSRFIRSHPYGSVDDTVCIFQYACQFSLPGGFGVAGRPVDVSGIIVAIVLRKSFTIEKRRHEMTEKKKRYEIKAGCPQCGCSFAQVLSEEEIREKYGDVPNVELECGECLQKFETDMETACPEWDKECKMKE